MQSLRIAAVLAVAMIALSVRPALADDSIEADANAALQKLYADTPAAKMIGDKAKAVLVFPNIVKAGFIVGAHYGEVLWHAGRHAEADQVWDAAARTDSDTRLLNATRRRLHASVAP